MLCGARKETAPVTVTQTANEAALRIKESALHIQERHFGSGKTLCINRHSISDQRKRAAYTGMSLQIRENTLRIQKQHFRRLYVKYDHN